MQENELLEWSGVVLFQMVSKQACCLCCLLLLPSCLLITELLLEFINYYVLHVNTVCDFLSFLWQEIVKFVRNLCKKADERKFSLFFNSLCSCTGFKSANGLFGSKCVSLIQFSLTTTMQEPCKAEPCSLTLIYYKRNKLLQWATPGQSNPRKNWKKCSNQVIIKRLITKHIFVAH